MSNPLDLFREWHREATKPGSAAHPNAMCVSTVDAAGRPHARFVDLKAVRPEGFVFCTSYASPKSQQIEGNPGVSLTFWWDHIGRQVRVLGSASRIHSVEADALFADRSREAQLASWSFDQSARFENGESRAGRMAAAHQQFSGRAIPRPPHWGGYLVAPHWMEFLRFHPSRAHERVLYEKQGAGWVASELQP